MTMSKPILFQCVCSIPHCHACLLQICVGLYIIMATAANDQSDVNQLKKRLKKFFPELVYNLQFMGKDVFTMTEQCK